MPPLIHLIRHGQAEHNVAQDMTIHDPGLTSLGYQECKIAAVNLNFSRHDKPVVVLASPLKRTIQTALTCFPEYTRSGQKIILVPGLQEIGDTPSDTGSSRQELESIFGDRLDYDLLTPDWTDKTDKKLHTKEAWMERARLTRVFIRSVAQKYKNEKVDIAVVTHGKYICYLTKYHGFWFKNTERHTYIFDGLAWESAEADLTEVVLPLGG